MQAKRYDDCDLLWPFFRRKLNRALDAYNDYVFHHGGLMPASVFETWRSMPRMNDLYAQGRSAPGKIVTNSKPGFSWHFYGVAADVVFKDPKTKQWTWNGDYDRLAPFFEKEQLEWLGKSKFPDKPHFQLTGGLSIRDAFEINKNDGLQAVWLAVEEKLKTMSVG
jgi:hypothetical protein